MKKIKTVQKKDLVSRVYEEVNNISFISESDVKLIVEKTLKEISTALENNEQVCVRGFGTFRNQLVKEKTGQINMHPKNKKPAESIRIPAHYKATLVPSKILKNSVKKIKVHV